MAVSKKKKKKSEKKAKQLPNNNFAHCIKVPNWRTLMTVAISYIIKHHSAGKNKTEHSEPLEFYR